MQLRLRAVVNAIVYVAKTGCQWRNLPNSYPAHTSVYYPFQKRSKGGVWQRLNRVLVWLARTEQGRPSRPSAAVIDSQSVKTDTYGAARGTDGHKKVHGRKRHVRVDSTGNLLEVALTAANIPDTQGAQEVMNKTEPYTRHCLQRIWVDSVYAGELRVWIHTHYDIDLAVAPDVPKDHNTKGFKVEPRRWVVERTFAWLCKARRLTRDFERFLASSEAFVYLASILVLLKRFTA